MSDANTMPDDEQPYAYELHLPNDDYSLVYAGYLAHYATEAERACDNIPLYLHPAPEAQARAAQLDMLGKCVAIAGDALTLTHVRKQLEQLLKERKASPDVLKLSAKNRRYQAAKTAP